MLDFLNGLLSSEAVLNAAILGILSLFGWLLGLAIKKVKTGSILAEVLDAIRVQMNINYEQVIRPKLKAAADPSSDGGTKITDRERKEMLQAVWQHLLSTLKGPALDYVKDKGFEWVKAKVEDLLMTIKAKAAQGKSPESVLEIAPPPAVD